LILFAICIAFFIQLEVELQIAGRATHSFACVTFGYVMEIFLPGVTGIEVDYVH
jgi:hypothetical protein